MTYQNKSQEVQKAKIAKINAKAEAQRKIVEEALKAEQNEEQNEAIRNLNIVDAVAKS